MSNLVETLNRGTREEIKVFEDHGHAGPTLYYATYIYSDGSGNTRTTLYDTPEEAIDAAETEREL